MRGSIKKDQTRGTWYFAVDIGIDPSTGKRRQKFKRGFKTRRAAEDALKDVFADSREGDYVEPSSQPVRTYLENWLKAIAANHKASTASMYAYKMRRYVIPRIGAMPLRQVDAAALDALYAELLVGGGIDDADGNPSALSEQTVSVVHRILHRALADAVKRRIIRSNPASDAVPPRSYSPRHMRVWDAAQMRPFLKHADADRLHALWVLAATTGMRRGEVCGLMWQDLNLDGGSLAVRRNRTPVAGKIVEATPKSDRARVIALAPATVAALRRHRKGQLEERLAWGEAWTDTGYTFTREDGTPLRPDWLSRRFEQLSGEAQLPSIGFHGVRHTFATLALAANVHPKVVQEMLGHANVGITLDLYSHVVLGMQEEAAAKIAGLIIGGTK